MFFGDPLPVETAMAWGLINRVVPKGQALETAHASWRTGSRPSRASRCRCASSRSTWRFDTSEEAGVRASLTLSDKAFASADCAEGVRAFFAKETPSFKHR